MAYGEGDLSVIAKGTLAMMEKFGPVSYTHLDVYKRQLFFAVQRGHQGLRKAFGAVARSHHGQL